MHRAKQAGFSLIELVIAMALFMFGITGIVALQARSSQDVQLADQMSLATNLTTAKLDELDVSDFGTLANGSAQYDSSGATCVSNCYFTTAWTITGTGSLRDVVVTTTWTAGKTSHSVQVASKVAVK